MEYKRVLIRYYNRSLFNVDYKSVIDTHALLTGFPKIYWLVLINFWWFPIFVWCVPTIFWPFTRFFWSNCINIQSENTNKLWERTKNLWDTIKKSWELTNKWWETLYVSSFCWFNRSNASSSLWFFSTKLFCRILFGFNNLVTFNSTQSTYNLFTLKCIKMCWQSTCQTAITLERYIIGWNNKENIENSNSKIYWIILQQTLFPSMSKFYY